MLSDSSNIVMPVGPMYGNNDGFGGNSCWWIILFLFAIMGGWGNGFGGYGGNQLGNDFPWLMNGQNSINSNTNEGFQNPSVFGKIKLK